MTAVLHRTLPRVLRLAGIAVLTVALPALLLVVWWLASASSSNPFFPPLSEIVSTGRETWDATALREVVAPSLLRLAVGYLLATVAGVVIGTALGLSRLLRELCWPMLEFLRAIPPPALVPVLIMLLGIGDDMRVAVIALGCVWPVLLNTTDGVRSVDPVQLDAARVLRLGLLARIGRVILPAASPRIATGLNQSLSIGLILLVISEMFAAEGGLGASIVQFQQAFAMREMWSGVLLLGLIGVALSLVFRLAEHRLLAWHRATRDRG